MSKHEIEVEGLPDGYEIELVKLTEKKPFIDGTIAALISVKKKQPRRIVLEETDEANIKHDNAWCVQHFCHGLMLTQHPKRWREVKETEEPKLCLSVEECENILRIAVLPKGFEERIKLFLRNNNKTS